MISREILLALACAALLAACQTSPSGYAERACKAEGRTKDSHAYKNCVDTTYARDRAISNRYASGGP